MAQPTLPRLEALGFENLTLEDGNEALTVWYENRRFFLEIEAMGRVLAETSRDLEASQSIAVVPRRDRIPLMLLRVNVGDLRDFLAGAMLALNLTGFHDTTGAAGTSTDNKGTSNSIN